jgi:hypothetical protein
VRTTTIVIKAPLERSCASLAEVRPPCREPGLAARARLLWRSFEIPL